MPLNTQIVRDGEALRLHWGDFHIAAMALAASFDSGEGPFAKFTDIYEVDPKMFECYPDAPFPIQRNIAFMLTSYPMLGRTPLNNGSYTLKRRHKFIDTSDGEVLILLPGDELVAVRGW
jgi:hypothetical protein